jgi:betaine-aldehyde dehydrogenase
MPAPIGYRLPPQTDIIAGERSRPAVELDGALADPNTGETLDRRRATSTDQVYRAIAAADESYRSGELGVDGLATRQELLAVIADRLEAPDVVEAIAVADSMNTGLPLTLTRIFAGGNGHTFRSAAAVLAATPQREELPGAASAADLHHVPWGPAAVLPPWNVPTATAAKKAAFALAAGCPVVLKPSEWAPSGSTVLAEVIADVVAEARLTPGTFQLVHGGAAVALLLAGDRRIRALCLTGGQAAGEAIAVAAARDMKALQLELGSNNPVIVRADADLDATADALVSGFTKLNGQWCESPGSVFVPAALERPLVDAVLDRVRSLVVGDAFDEKTTLGPQSNIAQRDRLKAAIAGLAAAGGRVESGEMALDLPGWFVAPTIVSGAPEQLTVDEIFGPVLTVHVARDDEEALRLANSRNTGLAGYVFSAAETAARALAARIDAGEVKVNSTSVLDLAPGSTQAFWGRSGVGGHGDAQLLGFFQGARIVGTDPPGLPI